MRGEEVSVFEIVRGVEGELVNEATLNPLECALNEAQTFRRQVEALQAESAKLRKQGYNDGYAEAMRDAGLERQTLHDMYYAEGYSDGHTDAWAEASLEMKRLRDCLHAILSRGEAPEHVMSDDERITDARSVPHRR